MLLRTARIATFLLVGTTLACASSGTQTGSSPASSASSAARSPNLITAQEIAQTTASNAYELVARLRPQWMRTSGVASIGAGARSAGVVAYVDNIRLSRFDELRGVSAESVTSIRYLSAEQAAALDTRGGPVAGAVVVSTRPGGSVSSR
jgi:hypothetical protein